MNELPLSLILSGSPTLLPQIHGGGDEGGGLLELVDGFLQNVTTIVESDQPFVWLPGVQILASNVHPLIVHFPIAFLLAFFVVESVAAWRRDTQTRNIASALLYMGAVSAVAAASAGWIAAHAVPHDEESHRIMVWHQQFGFTVVAISLVLSVWRLFARAQFSVMSQTFHLILAGAMTICIAFGADLGGLMVYKHGVGTMAYHAESEGGPVSVVAESVAPAPANPVSEPQSHPASFGPVTPALVEHTHPDGHNHHHHKHKH